MPTGAPEPALEEKVAFLSRPNSYPEPTERVESVQTHMSWVFLTDTHAWKLKKPVQFDDLDFSTPEARRRNCEEEIRLNRRLAPDVYGGVVSLKRGVNRVLQLEGIGIPVDWLVRMRRLPAERMFDRVITGGRVSDADLHNIATVLAGFYGKAAKVPITGRDYRARLVSELEACRDVLTGAGNGTSSALALTRTSDALKFIDRESRLLNARVTAGRIVEGHGDLRPEHICLEQPAVIIDCLEFNRNLRIMDPASELTFLALECERLGAAVYGNAILKMYAERTGDSPPDNLIAFYKSYHACIRARLAILHLKDHQDTEKWTVRARQYLELAG